MTAVARVLVDTGLIHLDRLFDYLIPEPLDASAQPGVRVRVRFAGVLRDGWLIERGEASEHRLAPLAAVVSPEQVLAPEIAALARGVADRWAGNATDVIRTAIPPRQAKVEKETLERPGERAAAQGPHDLIARYPAIKAFLAHVDQAPRASWALLPGQEPWRDVADLVLAVGAGVVVVVPDSRDVARLQALLSPQLGDALAVLTGELPAATRYRNFLRVRRGLVDVVIGTRSAVFAPLPGLRMLVVVDDGDESHVEPHAPGWNSRAVASLRAHQEETALIVAGHTVSVDVQALVDQGWLGQIDSDPTEMKRCAPRVAVHEDSRGARVPTATWQLIRTALSHGPVLISVPFTGYRPTVSCSRCRSAASCHCGGRLGVERDGVMRCRLCGADALSWRCPHCHGTQTRATSVGAERLVEEMGKAFPGVLVRSSTADHVVADGAFAGIMLATTGVEPQVPGGYAAVIVLDADAQWARSDLRAEEEARRRWFNALALAAPGAPAAIVGLPSHPAIQAVLAWAPRRGAGREVQERAELHLGPVWQMVTIEGEVVSSWQEDLSRAGVEVLGPLPCPHGLRLVARHPRDGTVHLATLVKELAAQRSARKEPTGRVRVDPYTLE